MRNEQWIFHDNSSVFGQIEKIFDWIDLFQKRLHEIQENCAEMSRVWIHCSLRMQECRDETEIYNFQRI